MNYNCKYCDYVDKCSRKCEYDSILCRTNRSFPKIVKWPYKEILYENSDLKLENTNLKQALNEIKEKIDVLDLEEAYDVLQIIDKFL